MSHLTDREFVDALDGRLPPAIAGHVRDCTACRDRLADLAETLAHARGANVPEPSPLFWDHLSARIRADISNSPARRGRWLAWPIWAPLAGLALVVALLLAGLVRDTPAPSGETMAVAEDVPLPESEALEALLALTADLIDSDHAAALEPEGLVKPGVAELVAADLDADEQVELVRLLQLELKAGG